MKRRLLPPLIILAAAFFGAAINSAAHDVPADVRVHMIAKPDSERLRILVRAPLEAMLDVDFPKRGPGYLDVESADPALRQAAELWIARNLEVYENDFALSPSVTAVRASLESDLSFTSYELALRHLAGPHLENHVEIYWGQALLDVLLEYPIRSDRSEFSVRSRLARLGQRVNTSILFLPPDGGERAFAFTGDIGLLRLDPRWHQAAARFVSSGLRHVLEGVDHLLFLLCLIIPLRRLRPIVAAVTAFTAAHSITLAVSALGYAPDALWFPPLIEALIAVSILIMALENILSRAPNRRWVMAFVFGLVHGFGFSFALRNTMQFAGSHMLVSLASFNAGVELGQVLALAAILPGLHLVFGILKPARERMGVIILSAFIAHAAWHWTLDRGAVLAQHRLEWPSLDAVTVSAIALWLFIVVLISGLIWLVRPWIAARSERGGN
ncbi:MAG TPA: HupE/UreJ family protein [Terriglobia bacterium]|nr:HupE/UreJ family protein [Terriglobia bacterium]